MANKLFVHIGPPKTGSTTIQQMLTDNRSRLLDSGIVYPFEESSHWRLALGCGLASWPWKIEDSDKRTWDTLRQISEENADKDILLSSENFSYAFLLEEKRGALHFLRHIFGLGREIHILYYLRRQDLWLESDFIENIKHLGNDSFEEFYKAREEGLHYDKVLDFWAGVASEGCLTAKVFERSQLADIRADFLHWLGITDISGFSWVEDQNQRPTLLQVKILQNYVKAFFRNFPSPKPDFNKPFGTLSDIRGDFMAKTADWPSTRKFKVLSYETAREILSKYEKGNEIAARKYLGRGDGRLFYDALEPYEYDLLDWPELTEDQQDVISTFWRETCEFMGLAQDAILSIEEVLDNSPRIQPMTYVLKGISKGTTKGFYSKQENDSFQNLTLKENEPQFSFDWINNRQIIQGENLVFEGDIGIVGWAMDPDKLQPPDKVFIVVNGEAYSTEIGIDRQDVVGYFDDTAYQKSGFRAKLARSLFQPGVYSIGLAVVDESDKSYYASPPTKAITIRL